MATKVDPTKDPNKCKKCWNPIKYVLVPKDDSQYSEPEAEHRRDTDTEDRFLESRWLSATSIRDRRKELAARCTYEAK